jgi:hypothetical protein
MWFAQRDTGIQGSRDCDPSGRLDRSTAKGKQRPLRGNYFYRPVHETLPKLFLELHSEHQSVEALQSHSVFLHSHDESLLRAYGVIQDLETRIFKPIGRVLNFTGCTLDLSCHSLDSSDGK